MTFRPHEPDDRYDSDAFFTPQSDDDLFDVDNGELSDCEIDPTDIEDLSIDDVDPDADADIEDRDSAYDSQDYSPGSTLLLDATEELWHEYCKVLSREPVECYRCLSIPLLYNFFDWRLNQKVGKDGRKIRGTKKKSSLGTYWKVFRLVFERATGDKVDSKMDRSMHKVLKDLAKKHGLSDERRANRCMTIDDLKG
ncbi:hypothetical protein BGZ61DRAFT_540262 [Ilyonectria robusta]|uniref:uncharacterized protein n=1 Tax=Ilyonectria robusta TaxID=1079257 RepID=UPI001E8EAECA|nr:uncharacterized protein BGZ61DRAFT_540262 [Ilyonectria robusta]KAH8659488.1 hypothetical protein BGZ61DRAFT_540262 [Ilyonectria robusta]